MGDDRPHPLGVFTGFLMFVTLFVFFSSAKFVRIEPVPGKRGQMRVVEDSTNCRLDPNAFGGMVPNFSDGDRMSVTQCDSLIAMLRQNKTPNTPVPNPKKNKRGFDWPEPSPVARSPKKK